MKRNLLLLLVFLMCQFIYSHIGDVHEYIMNQSLPVLGTTFSYGNDKLVNEVRNEDGIPDWVWGYVDVPSAHFWNQDYNFPKGIGFDTSLLLPPYSAYDKSIKYKNGWTLKGLYPDDWFTRTKKSIFVIYTDRTWNCRFGYVWRLGRISHLLEDMSVPAHVHLDAHTGIFGGNDEYESDFLTSKVSEFAGGKLEVYKKYTSNSSLGLWNLDGSIFSNYIDDGRTWTEMISVEDFETGNYSLDCGENCSCKLQILSYKDSPDGFNPKDPNSVHLSGPEIFKITKICTKEPTINWSRIYSKYSSYGSILEDESDG
ncbi:hypothetical protein KAU32_00055 [bacterium]|nr:hypothetical protein [bacterium]